MMFCSNQILPIVFSTFGTIWFVALIEISHIFYILFTQNTILHFLEGTSFTGNVEKQAHNLIFFHVPYELSRGENRQAGLYAVCGVRRLLSG